jgi:hypothetical protein
MCATYILFILINKKKFPNNYNNTPPKMTWVFALEGGGYGV